MDSDQQVVEVAFLGETADLFQQVFCRVADGSRCSSSIQPFFSAVLA